MTKHDLGNGHFLATDLVNVSGGAGSYYSGSVKALPLDNISIFSYMNGETVTAGTIALYLQFSHDQLYWREIVTPIMADAKTVFIGTHLPTTGGSLPFWRIRLLAGGSETTKTCTVGLKWREE